jgi:DNA-binding GntR family transcriptional regulator
MTSPSARDTALVDERVRLGTVSTVDALAGALRGRILEGDLEPGERIRERELTDAYGVARHSVRAALRALAADGLVQIEPNRGASVARSDDAAIAGLFELRTALEVEAARLALERHRRRLPADVREAVAELRAVCERPRPAWGDVAAAHNEVHLALVRASGSERIARAYGALAGELLLLLRQLKPHWTLARMAVDHERLVDDLEREGPDALRAHLAASRAAVTGSASRSPQTG